MRSEEEKRRKTGHVVMREARPMHKRGKTQKWRRRECAVAVDIARDEAAERE